MKLEKLQEGVLCNLKIGRWNASTKLPKDKLGKEVPKEIVRAMQDLLEDKSFLKNISTIRRMAKGKLLRHSIPFPIDGIWFVPKEQIEYLDHQFKQFKEENDRRVDVFIQNYSRLKSNMKKRYPAYYRPEKYPSISSLKRKFYFNWQFFHITLPESGKASVLSPKLYKKEQEKFQGMIKQMEEMSVSLIGQRLLKRIDRLSGQCASGKISSATVNSIDKFLQKWNELWSGYIDEKRLRTIMAQLKAQMKQVSADRLKDSEDLREAIGGKMDSLITKLKGIPNINLKRKLDL